MLYFLAELRHLWGPLRLFEYITFRAGAAAFTAFLIVALLGSWTARKLKQMNMQAVGRYEGILPLEMIDKEKFASLKSEGRVADGMIPKLTNSFKAIDSGVRKVIIKHAKNLLNNKGTTLK